MSIECAWQSNPCRLAGGGITARSPAPCGRCGCWRAWVASRRRAACPLHHHREADRDKGAARHQPTGARGEAGAHTARQGPTGRAGRSPEAHTRASGEARRGQSPQRRAPQARGHRASPLSPRIKYRTRGAQAPDGEKGGRRAVRAAGGKRGEPPRSRTDDTDGATEATETTERGAGRSARRRQSERAAQRPGRPTRASVGRAAANHTTTAEPRRRNPGRQGDGVRGIRAGGTDGELPSTGRGAVSRLRGAARLQRRRQAGRAPHAPRPCRRRAGHLRTRAEQRHQPAGTPQSSERQEARTRAARAHCERRAAERDCAPAAERRSRPERAGSRDRLAASVIDLPGYGWMIPYPLPFMRL